MLIYQYSIAAEIKPLISVVRVIAISENNRHELGSGVVVANNQIASNCHITRQAERILIVKADQIYPAKSQLALPDYDICLLNREKLDLPPVTRLKPDHSLFDSNITLIAYPLGLKINSKQGKIIALHQFKNSLILEINARFTHGSSGGGLFTPQGELISLMTFMTIEEKTPAST